MRILFLVALLDAAGFGIIIPIFLYYALQLGASPDQATMFFSIYPVALMLAAPALGLMSDKYGRKPIMLLTLGASVIGYITLGFAQNLLMLAFARLIQGAAAGNMSVVQAYVADITDNESRAKGMGTIGAATGLGFVIGPALGAWLGGGSFENTSLELAAFCSAGASLVALLLVFFVLPESLDQEHRLENRNNKLRLNPFSSLPMALAKPALLGFFVCAMLFNIAGAFAEVILPLWLKDKLLISGPSQLMFLFLCAGLVLSFTQAKLIGPINKRLGEAKMFGLGAIGYAVALILIALSGAIQSYPAVILSWCLAGVSMALFFTGIQSLVSQNAEPHERGSVMGAFSAVGTLGRVIGPSLTGLIYVNIHPNAPFYLGAALLMIGLLINVIWQKRVA
ncbi:MFS transporter [Oceanicoccus sp. KOV_DT_Chl]|uniref:MFS transporter n=1 Tax=Oceanicoccus sp. KOV_DT_Chl TaxID=1904639 RepID=UPI000C7B4EED|nr:MFS transporter [Oceanicoccus sp. KOV_DT_Chl]